MLLLVYRISWKYAFSHFKWTSQHLLADLFYSLKPLICTNEKPSFSLKSKSTLFCARAPGCEKKVAEIADYEHARIIAHQVHFHLYIYVSVSLYVFQYTINGWTDQTKFFVVIHMTSKNVNSQMDNFVGKKSAFMIFENALINAKKILKF